MSGETTSAVPSQQHRRELVAERLPRARREKRERRFAIEQRADHVLLPGPKGVVAEVRLESIQQVHAGMRVSENIGPRNHLVAAANSPALQLTIAEEKSELACRKARLRLQRAPMEIATSIAPETSTPFERPPLWEMRGPVRPARISPLYRLGTLAVAVAMVLLPLLYVALIAGVGYAIARYAVTGFAMFEETGNVKGKLLAYVAPLVVGALVVLFMIKPLFARRPKRSEPLEISRDDEPALFAFIDRICDLVCAPRPRRVLVDLQVNASASFRRGFLSLFGQDLTLTIGLPLVAGLNVRQFGGVLAHEFGHFAQGAGMRLTFVIRSVNAWFYARRLRARCVG